MGANGSMLLGRAIVQKEMLSFTTWNKKKIELMRTRHHHDLAGTFALGPRQFCILLGLSEEAGVPLFRSIFDTDKNNLVDAFEAMGSVAILANIPIQEKVDFIHSLYDFNGSGDITVDELIIMLRTIAVGCGKMDEKVIAPTTEVVAFWSQTYFKSLNRDLEDEIAKHEFDLFCVTRPEIANFLEYWQGGVNQVIIPPGKKFEDAQFRAGGDILYRDVSKQPKGMVPYKSVKWLRPEEFVGDAAQLFMTGAIECDLVQGQIANAWFVSALAILAGHPALLKSLFVSTGQEPQGRYCLKFYKEGNWINVYIDDSVPCSSLNRPLFTRPAKEEEIWACLIEKAYAKLHGRYEALLGGHVEYALRDITGGAVSKVPLDTTRRWTVVEKDTLWARLCAWFEQGVVGCEHRVSNTADGINEGHKLAQAGILQGLAYSVCNVLESEGNRLVKMRNAWGKGGFQGEWSSISEKWDQNIETAKAARFSRAPEGTFWMSFDEFMSIFNTIYVCRLPESDWSFVRRQGKFVEKGGGSTNSPLWPMNDQYFLVIKEESEVVVCLTQEDDKYHAVSQAGSAAVTGQGDAKSAIGFIVHSADFDDLHEAKKITKISQATTQAMVSPFRAERDVSLSVKLQPGNYAICPMTFQPDSPGTYWITVQGNRPFELKSSSEMLKLEEDVGEGIAELEQDLEESHPVQQKNEVEEDSEAVALQSLGETVSELYSMVQVLLKKKKELEDRIQVLQKHEGDED